MSVSSWLRPSRSVRLRSRMSRMPTCSVRSSVDRGQHLEVDLGSGRHAGDLADHLVAGARDGEDDPVDLRSARPGPRGRAIGPSTGTPRTRRCCLRGSSSSMPDGSPRRARVPQHGADQLPGRLTGPDQEHVRRVRAGCTAASERLAPPAAATEPARHRRQHDEAQGRDGGQAAGHVRAEEVGRRRPRTASAGDRPEQQHLVEAGGASPALVQPDQHAEADVEHAHARRP